MKNLLIISLFIIASTVQAQEKTYNLGNYASMVVPWQKSELVVLGQERYIKSNDQNTDIIGFQYYFMPSYKLSNREKTVGIDFDIRQPRMNKKIHDNSVIFGLNETLGGYNKIVRSSTIKTGTNNYSCYFSEILNTSGGSLFTFYNYSFFVKGNGMIATTLFIKGAGNSDYRRLADQIMKTFKLKKDF